MRRVVAIGLDAAERDLLDPLIERGELPNLAALRVRSARCGLRSDPVYRTTMIWESFVAGREIARHPASVGFGFDPATYTARRVEALGERAFLARVDGLASVAFDVPHLTVSDAGTQVCSWGGHIGGARGSHPPTLMDEIDDRFGPHPAHGIEYAYDWHRPDHIEALGGRLVAGADRRVDVARWLQDRVSGWELFLMVLSEPHSAGENFGHALDPSHPLGSGPPAEAASRQLHAVYRALDDAVGRLTDSLPDDAAVVLFALHGTSINDSDVPAQVLLPELLHRLQLGGRRFRDPDHEAWAAAGHPPVTPPVTQSTKRHLQRSWTGHWPSRPRRLRLRRLQGPVPLWYQAAWPRMRAFALPTFGDGQVRVNLAGREAGGVVPPDDYARACGEVEDWVRACRDPRTGEPAVVEVERSRADDVLDPDGPDADVIVRWAPGVDAFEHPEVGTIGPFPFRRSGGHTPRGFAWIAGAGVEPGDLGERPVVDLPPTLVSLLDRPVPDDVEGTPMVRVSTPT